MCSDNFLDRINKVCFLLRYCFDIVAVVLNL